MQKLYQHDVLGLGIIAYAAGFTLSAGGYHITAGCMMILAGLAVYFVRVKRTGSLVDLFGLFSLSWIGGQGVACFQLSQLQKDWSYVTWLCFFFAYAGVYLGFSVGNTHRNELKTVEIEKDRKKAGRLLNCIGALAAGSVACFLLEAAVVGFIPFFSDKPHAYSTFHVSGVHYFTISCILIPAITVIYSRIESQHTRRRWIFLAVCNITAVAIPILCVSRFQLLFAVGFVGITYLLLYRKITVKMVVITVLILIPVYIILTIARNHDVAYLNGIFEMKNRATPIFITQPYMYIANNFENFNCMVEQLTQHSYGLKMLFPVFALTGLKFVFPQLVTWPAFVTKTELTTLTMFYDGYYDFGIAGVLGLALLIGAGIRLVVNLVRNKKNPVVYLFYGQLAIYMGLSFFTTWFSVPTTWFWFVLTGVMYVYAGYNKKVGGKTIWNRKQ